VGALQKTPEGPVIYDENKCMGCRYCMVACPFDVPRYEWEAAAPLVRKCTFCHDQLAEGKLPPCVEVCPEKVSLVGSREEMLAEAHRRLKAKPDTYVQKVFGEHEAGGTSMLYVSDVPLGFLSWKPGLGAQALPKLTWAALKKVPPTILLMGGLMAGIYWFIGRRMRLAAEAADATTSPVSSGEPAPATDASDVSPETTAKEGEEKKND
jgi:formate dehydrogenase iron-sulfur subunit